LKFSGTATLAYYDVVFNVALVFLVLSNRNIKGPFNSAFLFLAGWNKKNGLPVDREQKGVLNGQNFHFRL
jgi:hypothetical protein